jgi:hypothetical protein
MKHDFIDPWTRIPRFTARLSVLGLSHASLSWAAFITNIPGSDFRYTQVKTIIVLQTPALILVIPLFGVCNRDSRR